MKLTGKVRIMHEMDLTDLWMSLRTVLLNCRKFGITREEMEKLFERMLDARDNPDFQEGFDEVRAHCYVIYFHGEAAKKTDIVDNLTVAESKSTAALPNVSPEH